MSNQFPVDLSLHRLNDSREKIKSAEILLKNKQFKDSISRSYYSMFSAARALLATKSLDSSKHIGIISLFNQHFVKTGMVSKTTGQHLMTAKEFREEGDYGDFVVMTEADAARQLENAKAFYKEAEAAHNKTLKET